MAETLEERRQRLLGERIELASRRGFPGTFGFRRTIGTSIGEDGQITVDPVETFFESESEDVRNARVSRDNPFLSGAGLSQQPTGFTRGLAVSRGLSVDPSQPITLARESFDRFPLFSDRPRGDLFPEENTSFPADEFVETGQLRRVKLDADGVTLGRVRLSRLEARRLFPRNPLPDII